MSTKHSIIINAQLHGYEDLQQIHLNDHGIVEAILPMDDESLTPDDSYFDVAGDWLSPGGVDLQINGALGLAFTDLTPEHLDQFGKICKFLWTKGVDQFCPTLVTTSMAQLHQAMDTLTQFMAMQADNSHQLKTAKVLGIHLEGPFLNPEKCGAHPLEHLQPLNLDTVKQVLGDYAESVKIITLAPEMDPTGTVIPYLTSLGITVSLGHSTATEAQAQAAFDQGASMVTHAFNAMPSLHHREPGLLGVALTQPTVYCGVIADGVHIAPTMVDMLMHVGRGVIPRLPYPQGLFLVSDALAPLGMPEGEYPWDTRQIEVKNGTARLPDDTLAGTTLPLLTGVQNLVGWGMCEVGEAIALATLAPRRALDLPRKMINQPVHLLRWHIDEATGMLTWARI